MGETILLVEDNIDEARQTATHLEAKGFSVQRASDGAEALALAHQVRPVAILSDVLMPNLDGFRLVRQIRQDPDLSGTPVVLSMAGWVDDGIRDFALQIGANAFVEKDTATEALSKVLRGSPEPSMNGGATAEVLDDLGFERSHGEQLLSVSIREAEALMRQRETFAHAYRGTLEALLAGLDMRQTGAAPHARRVAGYALAVADRLGLADSDETVGRLVRSAALCDVGNLGVAESVLNKPGPLTEAERRELQTHPVLTSKLISEIEALSDVGDIVLAHHERWDGRGYPRSLPGPETPLAARIIAVADALDSMTSPRPYREASAFETALQELARCSGTQFDPEVVGAAVGIGPVEWQTIRERADQGRLSGDRPMAGYL